MSSDMARQSAELRSIYDATLRHTLRNAKSVVLIDFPDHDNIGDSAIWLGEVNALARLGVKVVYAATHAEFSCDAVHALPGDVPILLHGGGNFGDLWLDHQRFREYILRRFKFRRIVQLPQSIHFESRERVSVNSRLVASHPDFLLMVRDKMSAEFASVELGYPTTICPDGAFAIELSCFLSVPKPSEPVVCLWRRDAESNFANSIKYAQSLPCFDWHDRPRDRWRITMRRARRVSRRFGEGNQFARAISLASYNETARREVRNGIYQLSRGRVIVTDRLHGVVLATLMGRPHVAIDNNYGKLCAVIGTWLKRSELTAFCADPVSAIAKASEWERSLPASSI